MDTIPPEYLPEIMGLHHWWKGHSMSEGVERRRASDEPDSRKVTRKVAEHQPEGSIVYRANLIDAVNDAVIARDADLVITVWNKAAERMYGWTAEEMVGKHPHHLPVHHIHGIERDDILQRLKNEGRVLFDTVQEKKDGSITYVEVAASTLHDSKGNISGYITVGRDVSERNRTDGTLKASERRLKGLMAVANVGIWTVDGDGIVDFVNSRMAEMLGYKPEEILGKHYLPMLSEKDAEISKSKFFGDLKGGKSVQRDVMYKRKDGSQVVARVGSSPILDEDGKFAGVISIATDISERIKNEDDLRRTRSYLDNLITFANAPIIVWDPLFRISRFNHAFENLTGFTANEVIGKELSILFPKVSLKESLSRISKTLAGERFETVEIPIQRRDGGVRTVLWNSANIYAEDGSTLVATIAQGVDITRRKEAEEQTKSLNALLAKQAIELETANMELEAFNYTVSHDLRAPLRIVDGFSSMLQEDCAASLGEKNLDYLKRIRAASKRMNQLIEDLLSLSRVSRDKINWLKIDLSAIAREVIDDLQKTQPRQDVEVEIADGAIMEGDPRLMRIVLENLLSNSWKFTGKKPKAKIELGFTEAEGRKVFFVKDNGVGFDMNYAGKLFQPFQRLHSEKEFSGTGIGLATSMRIMRRHGWRIWAESEVGSGATFFFAKREDQPNRPAAPQSERMANGSP